MTLAALLVIFASGLSTSAQAADPSIAISGVTFSWPEKIYRPIGSSPVTFTITNNSGRQIVKAEYQLINSNGSMITFESAIGLKNGVKTYVTNNWYELDTNKYYVEPLKLVFYVKFSDLDPAGNPAPVSIDFAFAPRPDDKPTPAPTVTVTATPAPAPTVTVTATPAPAPTVTVTARPTIDGVDVALLNTKISGINNQLKTLNAKIKKICSAKPKPKGC
jgi:hypothetical protein